MRERSRMSGKRALIVLVALAALVSVGALAYGAAKGPAIRTIALEHPSLMALDPVSGRALISTYRINTLYPDGRLSMLDVRTGRFVHTIDTRFSAPTVVLDATGRRLIVLASGDVLFLDANSGRAVARIALQPSPSGTSVFAGRGNRAYVPVAGPPQSLTVLNTRTGAAMRTFTPAPWPNLYGYLTLSDPAVDERSGRVVLPFTAVTEDITATMEMTDGVQILDADGHLLHTAIIGHFSQSQPGQITLPVVVDARHGRAIVPDTDTGSVTTLDLRNGRILNVVQFTPPNTSKAGSLPSLSGVWGLDEQTGRIFIDTTQPSMCSQAGCVSTGPPGSLYMVDTRTGRLLRRLLPGVEPAGVTVDARAGRVLVSSAFGVNRSATGTRGNMTLYLLDARTGALLHRLIVSTDTTPTIDQGTGCVYLVNSRGTIALLDTRSGRIVSALTVKEAAEPDQRGAGYANVYVLDGRVIVVRDNGTALSPDPLGWLPSWLRHALPWQPPRSRVVPGSISVFDAPR